MRIIVLDATQKERWRWREILNPHCGILRELPGCAECPETGEPVVPDWMKSMTEECYDEWTLILDYLKR